MSFRSGVFKVISVSGANLQIKFLSLSGQNAWLDHLGYGSTSDELAVKSVLLSTTRLVGEKGSTTYPIEQLAVVDHCIAIFEGSVITSIQLINRDSHGISYEEMVSKLVKPGEDILSEMTPPQVNVMHMAVGISGEAGELLDAIKKSTIYQKPLDRENVIEELGDLEFYMEGLRASLNITRQQTLDANMNKLLTGKNARYAAGQYTNKQAQDRADKQ